MPKPIPLNKQLQQIEKELDAPGTFVLSNLQPGLQSWISKQITIFDDLSDERKILLRNLEHKGLRLERKTVFAQKQWVNFILELNLMKKAWKPYGVDVEIKAPGIKKTILWGNKVGGQISEQT